VDVEYSHGAPESHLTGYRSESLTIVEATMEVADVAAGDVFNGSTTGVSRRRARGQFAMHEPCARYPIRRRRGDQNVDPAIPWEHRPQLQRQ
jgi:hypothetical protein